MYSTSGEIIKKCVSEMHGVFSDTGNTKCNISALRRKALRIVVLIVINKLRSILGTFLFFRTYFEGIIYIKLQ